jgi:hypothetical protein
MQPFVKNRLNLTVSDAYSYDISNNLLKNFIHPSNEYTIKAIKALMRTTCMSDFHAKQYPFTLLNDKTMNKKPNIWSFNRTLHKRRCEFDDALLSAWSQILHGSINYLYIKSPLGASIANTILIQSLKENSKHNKIATIHCSNKKIRSLLYENDVVYALPSICDYLKCLIDTNGAPNTINNLSTIDYKRSSCLIILGKDVNKFMGLFSEKWSEIFCVTDCFSDVPRLLAPGSFKNSTNVTTKAFFSLRKNTLKSKIYQLDINGLVSPWCMSSLVSLFTNYLEEFTLKTVPNSSSIHLNQSMSLIRQNKRHKMLLEKPVKSLNWNKSDGFYKCWT